jgi:hypothetical protein
MEALLEGGRGNASTRVADKVGVAGKLVADKLVAGKLVADVRQFWNTAKQFGGPCVLMMQVPSI